MAERFTYDRLNRLDSIKFNSVSSVMTYDPHGRMLSKQADGQMVFSGARYSTYDPLGNLKPHAISSATVTSGTFPSSHVEAEYTTFDKVKNLTKYDGNNNVERTLAYTYGYDHQRIGMEEHLSNSSYRTKTYVGNCEFNHDFDCARTLTYLSAPTGLFAVHMKEDAYYLNSDSQGSQRLLYLHKDHLGSITTITDTLGNIVQELSYDAWGNLRNPTTWSENFTGTPLIDRGFTGHEHLYGFGLINMNGRMYDPVMSSFLSVDSYVQDPENSQNFNRYAYCFNNPLKYTDPTGEVVVIDDIVAAAIVGAIINGVVQTASGHVSNFGDWCLATVIGGASGAAGAWAGGAAAGTLAGCYGGAVSGAVGGAAGGFIGGAGNTWMNGGSFGEGLMSGIAGAGTGFLSGGLMGGLMGGISAWNHGGDFWTGDGMILGEFSTTETYSGTEQNARNNAIGYDLDYKSIKNDSFLKFKMKSSFNVEEGSYNIETITTKAKHGRYGMTDDKQLYVNLKNKKIVRGFVIQKGVNGSEFHLSPKYANVMDIVEFKASAGHALIHCIHHFKLGRNFDILESEVVAYDYSIGVLMEAHREVLPLMEQVKNMGYLREINPLYQIHF